MWPLMSHAKSCVGALSLAQATAKADPAELDQALARVARNSARADLRAHQGDRLDRRGRGAGRHAWPTNRGDVVECEYVIELRRAISQGPGRTGRGDRPAAASGAYYVVSEAIDGLVRTTPQTLRDPDGYAYFKEEVRGLLIGASSRTPSPGSPHDEIPRAVRVPAAARGLEPVRHHHAQRRAPGPGDREHRASRSSTTARRASRRTATTSSWAGRRSSITTSSWPGSTPRASRSPAARVTPWPTGSSTASPAWTCPRWTSGGSRHAGNKRWLRRRVQEIVGLHFAMAWPNREPESARGVRRSPVHHLLETQGACFGTKMGWERVNWFAPARHQAVVEYGWGRQNWFGRQRRRARRRPLRGRAVRPDLVRQGRRPRPRRRARPAVPVLQRRRDLAGPDRLHGGPQRPRRLRGRRDA